MESTSTAKKPGCHEDKVGVKAHAWIWVVWEKNIYYDAAESQKENIITPANKKAKSGEL